MSTQPDRAQAIFLAAIDHPADSRADLLYRECAGDPKLRARVEQLLQSHELLGSYHEEPQPTIDMPALTETVGTTIGPYKLMEQIGEGGMGVVYVAEQREPVRRRVALKIIKPGMDTKEVMARFAAERQALAMMDHPHIAKVLDAGATEAGRPFFVMELVRGIPITKFCDKNKLVPNERMDLFIDVCHAIQHAHQKGILHRDIKPGNVLVASHDGKPVVKVIDFGVAKAINQSLTQQTVYTQFSQMVGTPLYMSPEQAEMSALDVDTRTDIYSLGVLLYELLTGQPAFNKERFNKAAFDEMRRIIREEEPSKPSSRISTLDETASSVCVDRGTDPRKLCQLLRGDLDWIVMKSLEKDRERRYETANGFALDIRRYLSGDPVLAAPPSAGYRLRKFVRRNKGQVIAASLVLLALLGGIIGTSFGLVRAERERKKAEGLSDTNAKLVVEERDAKNEATELANANKKLAEDESKAKKKAVQASQELAAKAGELQHQLGISHMILAETAFSQNNVGLSAEWLSKVPETQQGWAWHYLKRQSQGGLFTLRGHKVPVTCVAYSPDGKLIVTGAGDQNEPSEVRVWDARTGEFLIELEDLPQAASGYNTPVMSVAFSPDGKKIVTGGSVEIRREPASGGLLRAWMVGQARVWDARTGKLVLELKDMEDPASCVAFSPDGKRIATGTQAGSLLIWNAEKAGKPLLELKKVAGHVSSLAFSPDGERIVTRGINEGAVKVWDAEKAGKPLLEWNGIASEYSTVAFSPDGTRIVTGNSDGTAIVLDAQTGKVQLKVTGRTRALRAGDSGLSGVVSSSFSPDGTRFVTGGGAGDITVWNARTGEALLDLRGHTAALMSVAFSPDGEQILSGCLDLTAKVWDARTGSGRLTLHGHNNGVLSVAVSKDGTRIVTGGGKMKNESSVGGPDIKPGEATVWDAQTGKPIVVLKGFKGSVNSVAFSPNGKRVVTAGLGAPITGPPGTPTKRHTGVVTVWDAATGEALLKLDGHTEGVNSVAYNFDGTRIITAGYENQLPGSSAKGTELKVWNAQTGKMIHDLTDQVPARYSIPRGTRGGSATFSPDGKWIVAGGVRRKGKFSKGNFAGMWWITLPVWNAETGEHVRDLDGHQGAAMSLAFSPNGKWIVVGSTDSNARIWNAETGKIVLTLKGHQGPVTSVAFSPDNQQIITGSEDRSVRVWDAKTGTNLAVLKGQMGLVTSVAFSPDGKTIFSGGGEIDQPGKVTVWNTHQEQAPNTQGLLRVRLFSPSGDRFLIFNQGLKVCDAKTGTVLCSLKSPKGFSTYGFSPDGTRIVAGKHENIRSEKGEYIKSVGYVNVWNVKKGEVLHKIEGIEGMMNQVAFSRDGTRFVTTNERYLAKRVWDAETGKELPGEPAPPTVSTRKRGPDGRNLVRKVGNTFELTAVKLPVAEVAYRRLHTTRKWKRYQENYLAARIAQGNTKAEIAQNEFAAGFYLNLVPPDERDELVARGEDYLLSDLTKRAKKLRNSLNKSQALPLLERIVELQSDRLGANDLKTLEVMNELGLAYQQTNQMANSSKVFKKLMKLSDAKFGRDHLQTTNAAANLGYSYIMTEGKLEEGIPLLEEAYRSVERHPELFWVGVQLVNVYMQKEEYEKAGKLLLEQVPLARKRLPKASPQLGSFLAQVSMPLLKAKKWVEAEPLIRECLAIRTKTEPDAWTTFNAQSMLGGSLLGQKKYAEAEPLLLAGYNGMKKQQASIPEPGKPRLTEAIERLVQLYEETGKKDDADKWRKELNMFKRPTPAENAK